MRLISFSNIFSATVYISLFVIDMPPIHLYNNNLKALNCAPIFHVHVYAPQKNNVECK